MKVIKRGKIIIRFLIKNDLMYFFSFSMSVIAESALDRLARGLGGKTMLPHILNNVSTMLTNPIWKYRYNIFNYLVTFY